MNLDNSQLSEREKEVFELLLQGKSNKQIALGLGISNRTVEFHLSNIYAKLGVNSRSEAILKFAERHLRESTGDVQVESTVAGVSDSTENRANSISRRSPMKNLYAILGGLLAFVVIASIFVLRPSTQNVESTPAAQATLTLLPNTQTLSTTETPAPTIQPTEVDIPPHTVNGYTATIESYYVDPSHIIFQVRLTGGEITFGDEHFYDRIGNPDIYNENGAKINTSGGWGPAVDPTLYHFEFVPVTLLKGDRFKGQFSFDLTNAPAYEEVLARFRFDFDLPISPDVRFTPKQAANANGLEILLDNVTVTPTFTHVYLCYPSPSFADWNIGNQSVLQMDGQEASPVSFRLLFDSTLGGDRTAGSEPYWTPPIKNGRCLKSGFPIGSSDADSLTLTIPQLEKTDSEVLLKNQFSMDYPGLSEKQAYYTYLEEQGAVYKGPWTFNIQLVP